MFLKYHFVLTSQPSLAEVLMFAIRSNDIAKTNLETIKSIFTDDKLAKQVHNAAKRISKKRGASSDAPLSSSSKKSKPSYGQPLSPAQLEESLELPEACCDEDVLSEAVIYTNRAPLVCYSLSGKLFAEIDLL